jgi:methanesulfonate monooxygenase large subunit
MRHYYQEWGKWMNRSPSNPDQPYVRPLAAEAAE